MLAQSNTHVYVAMYDTIIIRYVKATGELSLNDWGRATISTRKYMNLALKHMFGSNWPHKVQVTYEKKEQWLTAYDSKGEVETKRFKEGKATIIYPIT